VDPSTASEPGGESSSRPSLLLTASWVRRLRPDLPSTYRGESVGGEPLGSCLSVLSPPVRSAGRLTHHTLLRGEKDQGAVLRCRSSPDPPLDAPPVPQGSEKTPGCDIHNSSGRSFVGDLPSRHAALPGRILPGTPRSSGSSSPGASHLASRKPAPPL